MNIETIASFVCCQKHSIGRCFSCVSVKPLSWILVDGWPILEFIHHFPSYAHMRQWTESALVQIMAFLRFYLNEHWLIVNRHHWNKLQSNLKPNIKHFRKLHLKMSTALRRSFLSGTWVDARKVFWFVGTHSRRFVGETPGWSGFIYICSCLVLEG